MAEVMYGLLITVGCFAGIGALAVVIVKSYLLIEQVVTEGGPLPVRLGAPLDHIT